jgi:hypothetical protein
MTFESKLEAKSTTGDDLKTFPMAEVEKNWVRRRRA